MSTRIAEYFENELEEWRRQLQEYRNEMMGLEFRLGEVVRRNTIPNISERVEGQQQKLNSVSKLFDKLQLQFHQQEGLLKQNSSFVDDSMIHGGLEKRQAGLRSGMQQAETDYIQVKHQCINFIAGLFRKK